MARVDQLTSLGRRLQTARELNETLVFEVLELCGVDALENVPNKYVLMDLCYHGNWDQAVLWLSALCLPGWTFELRFGGHEGASVCLTSPHVPPFTVYRRNSTVAQAALEAIVQAVLVLYKLRLRVPPS